MGQRKEGLACRQYLKAGTEIGKVRNVVLCDESRRVIQDS